MKKLTDKQQHDLATVVGHYDFTALVGRLVKDGRALPPQAELDLMKRAAILRDAVRLKRKSEQALVDLGGLMADHGVTDQELDEALLAAEDDE